ncbi:MAG: GTPase [candidate division WOR-3 bacterium]
MPANLTPEYLAAEERFRQAKTLEEKIFALKEMLATVPKHKGTEKLQKEIKTKLSKYQKELQKRPATRRTIFYHFEKKGAGQVAVFGFANAGKSSLVRCLTRAPLEVAPYPYTTKIPKEGMMPYENIQIQIIDTPPLTESASGGYFHILRSADALIYLLDLASDDLLSDYEKGFEILEKGRIPRERVSLIVGNKIDTEEGKVGGELLREICPNLVTISVEKGLGIEELKREIFFSLEIIRVYTKPPQEKPDFSEPIILKKNASVLDAAQKLHKDFARNLKYARIWSKDNRVFSGQRVETSFILKDGDIIEFHI